MKTISKALARTEATAAKKKPAKKAKKAVKKPKKPKKKKKKKKAAKKKKKKKKKKKAAKYGIGGKRKKGQQKSKKSKVAGKASALKMKKKGVGLFKPKTLSKDLAAICGFSKGPTTAVVKAVWVYIKKKNLNKGREVSKIPGISAGGSMFKLAGAIQKHLK